MTWSERPKSKRSLSADCHRQMRHPKAGLAEQRDSIRSSSSPPQERDFCQSSVFHLHQSAQTVSARALGLKSTDVKKTTQTRKQSTFGVFLVFHGNITSYDHILGIYYIFYCFHLSEQNKIPRCSGCKTSLSSRYSKISIMEFLSWNVFYSEMYSRKYIFKARLCF